MKALPVPVLPATREQLQALVDHSPDLIGRYDVGGRCLFVNRAGADALGSPPEELIGTYLVPPDGPRSGHGLTPESGAAMLALIREVVATGQSAQLEVTYLTPSGPMAVHTRLVPERSERNERDELVDVLAIGRDVTQVRRLERQLRDERRRYLEFFDNALDQMILLDICDGGRYRIAELNPTMQEAVGRPRADLVGRFQDEVFPAQASAVLGQACAAAIEAGGPVRTVLDLALEGGRRRFRATILPARDEQGRIVQVVGIAHDITLRAQAEQAQQRLNRALKTLSSGNEALVRAVDEAGLLIGMCRVMVTVGGHRRAWIGYVDHQDPGAGVTPMAWHSRAEEEATAPQPDEGWIGPPGPVLEAMATGRPVLSRPGPLDPHWAGRVEAAHRLEVGACLTMPLRHGVELLGVFVVHATDPDRFGPDELPLLTELAADLAYGIRNLRTRAEKDRHDDRMRRAMGATVQALADTTELRDPYTAGHQRRVAQLAEAVGRRLGLEEDRVAGLYLASTIHDIGKIRVPAEILGRPGRLSPLEFALVQQHVPAGYDLLKGIEFPWPVADIVGQHHERCDGSGYPNGLHRDELLLESRILAVCDVVEAMWSHRPYRPGLGMDAAMAEIERGRGTLYDAGVVDVCLGLLRSGRFAFR